MESVLPFVSSVESKFRENELCAGTAPTEVISPPRCIPESYVDSMYHVHEKYLNDDEISRHKRSLTMVPIDLSFSNQAPTQFNAYACNGGILSVPRFYGFEHFGLPCRDNTKNGECMEHFEFTATLNDIQNDACTSVMKRLESPVKGGIVVLPCGYGKTVCALYIAAQQKRRTLVLVHKAFLVEQWTERAKTFIKGCTVGKIQQNVVNADADIVIGMVQSLSKREYPVDIMSSFGMLIIDESHHMAAPILHKALRQIPARYIVSLSATPNRRDGLTCLLYWSMGSICYRIEREPEHTLVTCILYEGGKRKEIVQRNGQISMPLMLNALVNDNERNELIAQRIFNCFENGRNIIVLTDRIKQLNELFIKLTNMGVCAESMGFYIGTTKDHERKRSEQCRIILSTYGMAKEGLDIPRLDTLVLATPKGDVVQASGRVQRKCTDKKVPLLIDIVDTYSLFEKLRWKRWAFYRKESFVCQTYDANSDASWYV